MKHTFTLSLLLAGFIAATASLVAAPDQLITYKTKAVDSDGSTELKLHIFNPNGHKPSDQRPAIILFFGGGWNSGAPGQFHRHCEYLASRGMVAIAPEYRINSKDGTAPDICVQDGKSAIRWVPAHADKLGIHPQAILAGGGSAGGQIAAATALSKSFDSPDEDLTISSRPEALVLFNPVFDNGPGGFGHGRVKGYWQAFSPLHNIDKNAPPTIIFLGTEDKFVPASSAEKYKSLMEANGRRCELFLYEGQPHGFFNFNNREYYDKTMLEMDRFLVSLGYLSGDPKIEQ